MRILVCVKRVPAPGSRINVTADGQAVDSAHLGFTTSPHEECAVEAAVQLVGQHGGSATVLTLGPAAAEEQLRYAVSVGATDAVLLAADATDSTAGTDVPNGTDGTDWDPQRTASAIASAIRTLETDRPFDLILFGNESADSGGFQVGIRVAHALGRPMVNGAKGIGITGDVVQVRRETDTAQEAYELPLPAAVGVKEGINVPRYPTMKGRLASKKAEVARMEPMGDAGGLRKMLLRSPAETTSTTVVLGHGPEAAPAVVDVLDDLGVLQ